MTNKEFQEQLKNYPDDAVVCIEYCNPKEIVYDKECNLLKIN